VASWLGRAAQLVELDLRGNGAFGAEGGLQPHGEMRGGE
jgi:hypothetical protein